MSLIRKASWIVMAVALISNFVLCPAPVSWAETSPRPAASNAVAKPVSINKASMDELQTVRGIGPALAERIVSYRETSGGFKSLDQLKEVRGIGDAKFEKIKAQITI